MHVNHNSNAKLHPSTGPLPETADSKRFGAPLRNPTQIGQSDTITYSSHLPAKPAPIPKAPGTTSSEAGDFVVQADALAQRYLSAQAALDHNATSEKLFKQGHIAAGLASASSSDTHTLDAVQSLEKNRHLWTLAHSAADHSSVLADKRGRDILAVQAALDHNTKAQTDFEQGHIAQGLADSSSKDTHTQFAAKNLVRTHDLSVVDPVTSNDAKAHQGLLPTLIDVSNQEPGDYLLKKSLKSPERTEGGGLKQLSLAANPGQGIDLPGEKENGVDSARAGWDGVYANLGASYTDSTGTHTLQAPTRVMGEGDGLFVTGKDGEGVAASTIHFGFKADGSPVATLNTFQNNPQGQPSLNNELLGGPADGKEWTYADMQRIQAQVKTKANIPVTLPALQQAAEQSELHTNLSADVVKQNLHITPEIEHLELMPIEEATPVSDPGVREALEKDGLDLDTGEDLAQDAQL